MLDSRHESDLANSGLTTDQIEATGHYSADVVQSKALGLISKSGLIFNYLDPVGQPYQLANGKQFTRIKPDWTAGEKSEAEAKGDQLPKYLSPKDCGCRPYFSRLNDNWQRAIKSTAVSLVITEGEKKADLLNGLGIAAIGLGGVSSFVDRCPRDGEELEDELEVVNTVGADGKLKSEKQPTGRKVSRYLPELADISHQGRRFDVVYDSDLREKIGVKAAQHSLAMAIRGHGGTAFYVPLPTNLDGSKNGADDFISRYGVEYFRLLQLTARPVLKVKVKELVSDIEPTIQQITLMAAAVLSERWAFRPGFGWFEWEGRCWIPGNEAVLRLDLQKLSLENGWNDWRAGVVESIFKGLQVRLTTPDHAWTAGLKQAFVNGTYDFKSHVLTEGHNRSDYLTSFRDYAYDVNADCPTWRRFLNEALEGDQGLVELIRATFKYWVEPIDKGAKAVIEKCVSLIGDTGTGKGTLLEVLIAIIGERFVGAFDANTFSSPEKLAVFVGKDLAIDADADPVFMSATGTFSKVVSNEPVAVKILFKDPTTVRLGVRLIRAMNEMPPANGGRHGGDRREIFIPFDKKPDVIDPQLSEKLRAELPGIFQWAHQLDASVMHHTIANWASCKKVAAKTAENWIQRNTEYRFLLDEFPSGAVRVGASDLYKQYKAWCSLNGFAPKNNTNFGKAMAGFQGVTSKKSNGVRYSIPSMESYNVMQHFGGAKASPSTATQGTTEEFITEYNYTVGDEDAPPPDADEYGADGLNVDGFAPFKPESSDTGPGYWNGRN